MKLWLLTWFRREPRPPRGSGYTSSGWTRGRRALLDAAAARALFDEHLAAAIELAGDDPTEWACSFVVLHELTIADLPVPELLALALEAPHDPNMDRGRTWWAARTTVCAWHGVSDPDRPRPT